MKTILITALFFSTLSILNAEEHNSANADAVNAACAQDATTASCGDQKVGTGLLKCIHAYKKANKDFKVSESCKTTIKKLHDEKKDKKNKK